MTPPILVTKLFIPTIRPDLVSRSRLVQRLNVGLHRKFTLISAPAGFGKTTLAAEWLQSLGGKTSSPFAFAWLSLDEGDNDPVRFQSYLIAALNQIDGVEDAFGKRIQELLKSPQPPTIETTLISLINEIATLPKKIIFVLDDFHLIEAQPIHNALNFLLENCPSQLHLVMTTREDPPLPLSRLRARNQLTELRAADLRFSISEAAVFLNQAMGLNLSTEDVAALEVRTEGWIAGLQLAAVSMQGRTDNSSFIQAFTGSNRLVLDYLIEEVLDRQSEAVQEFLLKTAVLTQLNGDLCDAVTGLGNGCETLHALEQANLFIIPLDDERHSYRYHHLFADLLRRRLRQTRLKELPILHRRASDWYEQKKLLDEAINHALQGKNFERAAHLIDTHLDGDYEVRDQRTLRRWLAAMPEDFVLSKPDLCILHGWNLFIDGQLDAANKSLQMAVNMLGTDTGIQPASPPDKEEQSSDSKRKELLGRAAAIQSFIASYSGNLQTFFQYAHQAMDNLPEHEQSWRSTVLIGLGDAYARKGQMDAAQQARSEALEAANASGDIITQLISYLNLADIARQQGKLHQVLEICESQYKRAEERGIAELAIMGWLQGIWGELLAEINALDQALIHAKKGVELAIRGEDVMYISNSHLNLARVLFSMGNLTGAEELIQKMEHTAQEHELPLWASNQLAVWQMRIWLAQGKLQEAIQRANELTLDSNAEPTYVREMEYFAFARILIAQGKLDEATNLLNGLLEAARAGNRSSKTIEALILLGICAHKANDTTQAFSTLEQALTLAQPEGFIRIFVDEGAPMAQLLYESLSHDVHPNYVRQLLASFPLAEPAQTDEAQTQASEFDWIEPLTERESEVLQLIAEGLKNQEISSRLYLSLNTIKVHNRNIFSKLGVNSRTQAIARARAMGLLKST